MATTEGHALKRYHLFSGTDYDGPVGLSAYRGAFETLEEAKAAHDATFAADGRLDWAEVAEVAPDGELVMVAYWYGPPFPPKGRPPKGWTDLAAALTPPPAGP